MSLHICDGDDFEELFRTLQGRLIEEPVTDVGQWQSRDDTPMNQTHELANTSICMSLPQSAQKLAKVTGAHLPWAEDHFLERVSGEPLNPSPSEAWWPFASKKEGDTNKDHKSEGEAFSHTYPERLWPKLANNPPFGYQQGIRFAYGDLRDVVVLLCNQPGTRQAYLPLWFPEDTGVVHGKRVPCTLGYHFMIRDDELQITYYMRSCDLIRHFQDDVYMAGRLAQWVVERLNEYRGKAQYSVSELIMHIVSLHCFEGDIPGMTARDEAGESWPKLD